MENKSHIHIIKGTTVLFFIGNVAMILINERNKHRSAKISPLINHFFN